MVGEVAVIYLLADAALLAGGTHADGVPTLGTLEFGVASKLRRGAALGRRLACACRRVVDVGDVAALLRGEVCVACVRAVVCARLVGTGLACGEEKVYVGGKLNDSESHEMRMFFCLKP